MGINQFRVEAYSLHLPDTYNSRSAELGSSRTRQLGGENRSKKERKLQSFVNTRGQRETDVMCSVADKASKGSVGEGENGKKGF